MVEPGANVQVTVTVIDAPTVIDSLNEQVVLLLVDGGYPVAPAGPDTTSRLTRSAPSATPSGKVASRPRTSHTDWNGPAPHTEQSTAGPTPKDSTQMTPGGLNAGSFLRSLASFGGIHSGRGRYAELPERIPSARRASSSWRARMDRTIPFLDL